jgi:hypothetical protein
LRLLPFSVGRFASLRFRPKNMSQHIFQFESELQNSSQEAAPSSPSLSPTVSEKLERYGSSALSGVEHLTLILGKEGLALALVRQFGSIKALSRASIQQLLQFLPRRQTEMLVAALSMSTIAESEHARSEAFDGPESVYSACADMKLFNQEVLRVILLQPAGSVALILKTSIAQLAQAVEEDGTRQGVLSFAVVQPQLHPLAELRALKPLQCE